jgi:hypothetical protein
VSLLLHIIRDAEQHARFARAKLRALELKTGQATDDDGRYWLQRVTALEHVATAARNVDDTAESLVRLHDALATLDRIRGPLCRPGDHLVEAS